MFYMYSWSYETKFKFFMHVVTSLSNTLINYKQTTNMQDESSSRW